MTTTTETIKRPPAIVALLNQKGGKTTLAIRVAGALADRGID